MADRLQAPLISTLGKRKSDDVLGKQNAMEHKATVQEDCTHREWEAKGKEGRAEQGGRKAEDESGKVEDEEERVKVKDEMVQRAINIFTVSNVEIEMSALSYLAAGRREN